MKPLCIIGYPWTMGKGGDFAKGSVKVVGDIEQTNASPKVVPFAAVFSVVMQVL